MMKRMLAAALSASMVLTTLSGCSGQSKAPEEKTTASVENTAASASETKGEKPSEAGEQGFEGQTLTVTISTIDGEIDAITAQIKAFEEKYGVTVDLEILPQGDEGENLKLVRIATGAMADIFMSAVGAKLTELSPKENIMDLTGQPFLDHVDDKYRSIVTMDGATYGVPMCPSNVAGVFYNTKVYEQLGL